MGAGKGHTLKELLKSRDVRLPRNTVWIDPDALSRLLPERPQYVSNDPENASALLHPEASLLQEVCAAVAREQRRSLVVDGSLTDCGWFEGFMRCAVLSFAQWRVRLRRWICADRVAWPCTGSIARQATTARSSLSCVLRSPFPSLSALLPPFSAPSPPTDTPSPTQSAPEDVMLRRADKRAKATGRVTHPEAIKRSRIKSPECVTKLSKPGLVRR